MLEAQTTRNVVAASLSLHALAILIATCNASCLTFPFALALRCLSSITLKLSYSFIAHFLPTLLKSFGIPVSSRVHNFTSLDMMPLT
jgi:hypothetical protein